MDFDQKLDALGGMSAFAVTRKYGYPCHESQQYTWFTDWINGKNGVTIAKASQIATYNPAQYGLYRSTVGADVQKNDLFENVTTYAEQERLEQERLEKERQRAEKTRDLTVAIVLLVILMAALVSALLILRQKKTRRRKARRK